MNYQLLTNIEVLQDLGNRLKQQRLNQNLTVKELAQKSGVSMRSISAFENGNQNMSVSNLMELMRALNLIERLKDLIPELPLISPIEMMEIEKKRKKRSRK